MFDKDVAVYIDTIQKNAHEINIIETEIEKHYAAFEKLVEDKRKVQSQILDQSKVMNDRIEMLRDSIATEEESCSKFMDVRAQDLSERTRQLQQDQQKALRM